MTATYELWNDHIHLFTFEMTEEQFQEVHDWCEQQFGSESIPLIKGNNVGRWVTLNHQVFIISDDDAAIFKLRWC